MAELIAGMAGTRVDRDHVDRCDASVTGEVEWCGEDVAGVVERSSGRSTLVYLASVSEVTSIVVLGVTRRVERARSDAAPLDELLDLFLLQADDAPESIGRELAVVDEPVEGAGRDAQPAGGLGGVQPDDAGRRAHAAQPSLCGPADESPNVVDFGNQMHRDAPTRGVCFSEQGVAGVDLEHDAVVAGEPGDAVVAGHSRSPAR